MEKLYMYPFNPVFIMLLIPKSFQTFPKQSEYGFISETFVLNSCVFVSLTNKKMVISIIM